jgi:very-short-patch-repair endonuclease
MEHQSLQPSQSGVWSLVRQQHWVVTRQQLLELGFTKDAIKHRIRKGRLHPVWRGVYAVGRRQLTQYGHWLAAVLACGSEASLSHPDAGALLKLGVSPGDRIHVSVPVRVGRTPAGIIVHRRARLRPEDIEIHSGIPVTSPICTLIDLATFLDPERLERVINQADKLDLVTPEQLRRELDRLPSRPGMRLLRQILDRPGYTVTDSELEQLLLPIVRRAGLDLPLTRQFVNGYRVDFYWPDLCLIVETDGLRYHRTPLQQERDRLRDQTHAASGLTTLRFTRHQVKFRPNHVAETLAEVARRLAAAEDFGAS